MPRHTLSSTLLWLILVKLLTNSSVRQAVHSLKPTLALESVYHLLTRLRLRLASIRVCLCKRHPPPQSQSSDPIIQTVQHLKVTFAAALCPVREFQLIFQQPLLG